MVNHKNSSSTLGTGVFICAHGHPADGCPARVGEDDSSLPDSWKEGVQMNFGMILDFVIMICGAYVIYETVQMKTGSKIPEMLTGKGFLMEQAKDPAGFIRFILPYTLGTGIALLVSGLFGMFEILETCPPAETVMRVALVVVIVVYGMVLMYAQKKYLAG